jgi:hypothetical protein
MELGIYHLTQYDSGRSQTAVWEAIRDVAVLVDESGFDSLSESHTTPAQVARSSSKGNEATPIE